MTSNLTRKPVIQNSHIWTQAAIFSLLILWSSISAAGKFVTGELLSVDVDVETCAVGYTWCNEASPTGVSQGAATVGNHSPVMLMIQLISPTNQPVTGLTVSDFSVSHIVSPSGSGVVKPDPVVCPACFRDEGNGVYRLLVQRNINSNPWLTGTYFTHLEIFIANTSVFAVVPIKIQ